MDLIEKYARQTPGEFLNLRSTLSLKITRTYKKILGLMRNRNH
jgi:hypothetical protein